MMGVDDDKDKNKDDNLELIEITLTDPQSEDAVQLGDTPEKIPIPPKLDFVHFYYSIVPCERQF